MIGEQSMRTATLPENWLPALRMYVQGERYCDVFSNQREGLRCFRKAIELAWELSCEEWPDWAERLYKHMQYAPELDDPVPLLDSAAKSVAFQPEFARFTSKLTSHADLVDAVASALRARNFAVSYSWSSSPKLSTPSLILFPMSR